MASRRPIALLVLLASACAGGGVRRFPLREPMARDDDMRPFPKKPGKYFSGLAWDGLDNVVFRPIVRFFAVDPGRESVNVNALDEVPDSSWFTNRLGKKAMSPEDLARGPCVGPPLDPDKPWKVIAGKPNGANPGFTIEDGDGRKFLVKLEGVLQPERAGTADVVGSRIYWAAGFHTPCNSIVFFRRDILKIAPDAEVDGSFGRKHKLTEKDLDKVFKQGVPLADGRYRANASLFIDGKPLGPFRFHSVRGDDPNDVVRHEDRRELRGSKLLAAWIHHFDAREQNTMDAWVESPSGGGFIRHYILDWGDCFGSLWDWDGISRRIGFAYYFDFDNLLRDFVTLGIPRRPWDRAKFGPAGVIWGYFDSERFDPESYHPGYPNPAFIRMSERDGAWMARIIARFTDDHLRALVDLGHLSKEISRTELLRILRGRRDAILRRYLGRLSALSEPRLREEEQKEPVRGVVGIAPPAPPAPAELCLDDLAVASGVAERDDRRYAARAWIDERAVTARPLDVRVEDDATSVCVKLPEDAPPYLIVDVLSFAPHAGRMVPARVHLYHLGPGAFRVVGLERPDDDRAPGG